MKTEDISGITPEERDIAKYCIEYALGRGASQARVSLGKNTLNSISFLNGEVDKVTRCADRSLYINLFAGGRYGGYSTNRLDRKSLSDFIDKALENTGMLAPDPCRCLPDPDACARDAVTGEELALTDPSWDALSAEERLGLAAAGAQFRSLPESGGFKLISEECEWSDSTDDNYVADSQGFEGRHRETSFNFWTEITVEDTGHTKYSGYHWESSPFLRDVDIAGCSRTALRRAADAIGPKALKSGKYTLVVENTSASRLAAPLINALSASSIQQNNSFLTGSLGRKIFSEQLNIFDFARTPGKSGSRLFDSEGVATKERGIISGGVVDMYFVNTYMSKKMGLTPTIEGASRPTVLPFLNGQSPDIEPGNSPTRDTAQIIDLQKILEFCGEGVLVTGFNGGNCNPTTGNFSYGVEGFYFRDGQILHPVKETLITGNMITLWNSLIAAGADAREGTRWQIPTLAFAGVDFSA